MFTAITKSGNILNTLDPLVIRKLKKIRNTEDYFCPDCKEKVILKMGTKRITHFSHDKNVICSHSEPESQYHLTGKLQLFNWLLQLGLKPMLEPFFESIRQRPDIAFQYNGKKYVFEFQCSIISDELFILRTRNYLENNYIPIWILGGKNIQRKSQFQWNISRFNYLFLKCNQNAQWILPAYCPVSQTQILLHQITPVSSRQALAHFSLRNLHDLTFSNFLIPSQDPPRQKTDWITAIKKYKSFFHIRKSKTDKALMKELYYQSIPPSLLPPEIGIPLNHSLLIETPVVIWQAYIFLDHLFHTKEGSIITLGQIFYTFEQRMRKKQIYERRFPLQQTSWKAAVMEYIEFLTNEAYLSKIDNNKYRIELRFVLAQNHSQQRALENDFYKKVNLKYNIGSNW